MPKTTRSQVKETVNALAILSYSFGQLLAELEIAGADIEQLRLAKAEQKAALSSAVAAAKAING